LPVQLAKPLEVFSEARYGPWLFTQERLQSFADLLRDGRAVGMVNINSVAHGNFLTWSKPTAHLKPGALEAETAAFGYLRERSF
jgi:hypothetical protein